MAEPIGMNLAAANAMIAAFTTVFILIGLGIYVYTAWALMTIGKKLNYKYPWLAWIPGANIAMILELGGYSWKIVFIGLVGLLGFIDPIIAVIGGILDIILSILVIVCMWRIYEQRKYPGYLSLLPILPIISIPFMIIMPLLGILILMVTMLGPLAHFVVLGLVAWQDRQ